jgi:uncharacterized protein YdbL (DUF1318 family)
MYKKIIAVVCVTFLSVGCASVEVKAPKDPIKVDISMRLDVYQHVEKDIDSIENSISGSDKSAGKQSWLHGLVKDAYAEEGFGPEVDSASEARKSRRGKIMDLLSSGVAGEGADGMLEVIGVASAKDRDVVIAENNDRMTIYKAIARKNGTSIKDVSRLYSKRLQKDAPGGAMIQSSDGWVKK